jgi:hypothetical protein
MSKTKMTAGLSQRLKSVFHRLLGMSTTARSRVGRRLAPLQELEDRCLLSVTPVHTEYRVNTYTQGAQQTFPQTPHAVAMNPSNGNYVVVWSSQGQNAGGGWDVYFQRYNAAGVAQGAETLVDTPANGVNQQYANVAMNASGNFVVTWSGQQGGNWNIYARQYNASGVAQSSAFVVDIPTNADQEYSTVSLNDAGVFIVTWSYQVSGTWQIYGNAFNWSGVSVAYGYVTNASADQMYSDVALNDADTMVITWSGHQSGHWNVYAEMFSSISQPEGIFQVNTNMTDDQENSAVAMDSNGNFTITWQGHQSGQWLIYAQSYLSNGAVNGSNFQVSPTTGQDQEYSSIAFAGDGNPIITWSSNGSVNGWGVYAQQFTPTGTPLGSEVHVNTYVLNDQFYSSIAGSANGDIAIVWTSQNEDGSNFGVYGQNFTTAADTTTLSSSLPTEVYGQSVTFTATVSGNFATPTGTVTFMDGTTTLDVASLSGGTATYTTSSLGVATHMITAVYDGDATYGASTSSALSEVVNPATLTVSANAGNKFYGQTNPVFTDTITGFVNGDTSTVVSGSASLTTAATDASPVGSYIFSNGTLTISPAVLTVTANEGFKAYGQVNPTFTDTITGFVNGDTSTVVSGSAALTTAAIAASPVGNYTITAGPGSLSATNYTFAFSNGTLTVSPAVLTVTVNASNKVYGQVNPGFTDTITGFVNGDRASVVGGNASLTTTATAASGVGGYAITAGAGSLSAANYTFAFSNGTLTVNPAVLTVTANASTKVYGQVNPTFTDTISGFVNDDTSAVVSGSASLTTTATTASPVGAYIITAAPGSLNAVNYTFAFNNGTLTIHGAGSIAVTPVSPPASSASDASAILGLISPHSSSSAAAANGDAGSNSMAAFATKILQVSAITSNGGSGNSSLDSAAPPAMTQAEAVANRTLQIFAPVPRSVWQPVQDDANSLPEELPFRLPASRIVSLRSAASQAQATAADDLFDVLNDDGERIPWTESNLESTLLVGTGVLAGSGYVLLNSRLGLWFLGLLTARPLWKQFDPLEVLYAWEDDGRNLTKDAKDEETLMSLVD